MNFKVMSVELAFARRHWLRFSNVHYRICYNQGMTIQEIQRLREARPFEPFRVLVADGKEYNVIHPEHLAQSPSGRLITIGLDDDSFVTLDLLLVAGIQKGFKRKSRDGHARRSRA